MAKWQLQEAKNRLSELIYKVETDGPQVITRHGVEVVAVISIAEHKRKSNQGQRLGDFFMASPMRGSGIEIDRDRTTQMRSVDFVP
jgi:prevent-host-death family protein